MKEISFNDFEKIDFNTSGISRAKLSGICEICQKAYLYHSTLTFMLNRKKYPSKKDNWNSCQKCWYLSQTSKSEDWRKKNSDAQKIAQNRPEQKKKNAEGVSKSWTEERKKTNSEYLKSRWKTDEEFANKAMQNISWTQSKGDRFNQIMHKSLGRGGHKGIYNNLYYGSCLELSFIMWCETESINIKKYDLMPVSYLAEDGVQRKYYPDFIINNDTIVEIKGMSGYQKNPERTRLKIEAGKKHFKKYICIFQEDKILTKYYQKARKYHGKNCIKKDN